MKSFTPQTFPFSKTLFIRPIKINGYTNMVNYKNIFLLRKYISIEGKILPRRLTNLSAKQQRDIAKAIKNARIMGFLPFVRHII